MKPAQVSGLPIVQELVLLGGGHANVQVLKSLAMRPILGLRVTLISDQSYAPYSGMLPEFLAGGYDFDDCHFDLRRLAILAGARFVEAKAVRVDVEQHRIELENQPSYHYDLLSLNLGATPRLPPSGLSAHLLPLKPISRLLERWQSLSQQQNNSDGKNLKLAVVGGGAAGCEIALVIRERSPEVAIDLWQTTDDVLPGFSLGARRKMHAVLKRRHINLHLSQRVADVDGHSLISGAGERTVYDHIIWAVGAEPPALFQASDLQVDESGFVRVDRYLRCIGHANIFAAGDCSSFPQELPKSGVYAVRQGKTLVHNLRAYLLERSLQPFKPQRTTLALLRLGAGKALANKGVFSASGTWLWFLKDYIDRRFMQRWQDYRRLQRRQKKLLRGRQSLYRHRSALQMRCGGCAAKLGASQLATGLNGYLPSNLVPQKIDFHRDASISQLPSGERLAESVDMIKNWGLDPYRFAKLAAHHALSDLYAVGAKPESALAIIELQDAAPDLLLSDFQAVMQGISEVLQEEKLALSGGHTLTGDQFAIGLSVRGSPLQQEMATGQVKVKPGDGLLLTRPIGTGVLYAGLMDGHTSSHALNEALQQQLLSPSFVLEWVSRGRVLDMTDVTGFGLGLHCANLVERMPEATAIELYLDRVPLYHQVATLMKAGVKSSLARTNRDDLLTRCGSEPRQEDDGPALEGLGPFRFTNCFHHLLIDPQTCGGLLILVPQTDIADCLRELHERGFGAASLIGRVLERQGGAGLRFSDLC